MNYRIIGYLLLSLVFSAVFSACRPYEQEELTDVRIDLRDSLFQRLYNFQHEQRTDSLIAYFSHRDPTYRYLAAMAFASIRDSSVIDTLAPLLRDRVDEVRAAAAYALGQTGSATAAQRLIEAFDQYDTLGVYRRANRAILEAVGKVGTAENLKSLATISTYQQKDTALLEGQAWGIYRFALREIIAPEGTAHMLRILNTREYPVSVRFIAANYLHRAKNIMLDSLAGVDLARTLASEQDARIRMAIATALGKVGTSTALASLIGQYRSEEDYRVKCNILRALSNFGYAKVQPLMIEALHDKNRHLAGLAGQFFRDKGIPEEATLYWRLTRDSLPWQAQIPLFAAALRHLPGSFGDYRDAINFQLRRRFEQTQLPFVKVAALEAMTEYPWNFRYLYRMSQQSAEPVVRAAAVQAMATISENRRKTPGIDAGNITRELAYYFQEIIGKGDPAVMAPAAEALKQPERNYAAVLDTLAFLDNAIAKLDSAKDIFTYQSLREARHFLSGKKEAPGRRNYPLKPIDWKLLGSFSVEPMALIRTTKGVIQIRLLPSVAPASVANFIQLARGGFYRGKYFYRVVPNFVIQGAESLGHDPIDFTIRSELPQVYFDEGGLLGMASSGNHTESTQFFITHSPTPHLDGNYTIFGRVIQGMDVVDQIHIGDKIEEIIIQ